MSSEISICNQALGLLGASPITSFDDPTTEAQQCKLHYAPVRDAVLEAHNWTFATKWAELNKLANPPIGEFANAFRLPPETIRVIFVGRDYRNPDYWRREGNNIVTDADECIAQIIYLVTDPSQFSALFEQALAHRLASDMAIAITNSRTMMETHYQVYVGKVREAARVDGLQGRSRKIKSNWLTSGRHGGGGVAGPTV